MSDLPETIRAFIAVRIPDSVRAQLTEVHEQLKPELRDVSWTRPDAMHLTLQFLGGIPSARLPELECALRAAGKNHVSFELALSDLGSFGNRVIWIGVKRGEESLHKLADDVRAATRPLAERGENREFSAHVTLGRIRRPTRRVEAALQKTRVPAFQPWTVSGFELIRSELSPEGSRYTNLSNIELERRRE